MAKMKFRAVMNVAVAMLLGITAMPASAHSVSATMDPAGISATFTGFARVTCFDDGNGAPVSLIARIRDNSASISGLMVNLQIIKGAAALNITDPVSADSSYSDYIALPGGNGEYLMMVNKTGAGARNFDLEWHCMTAANAHTGTDIAVQQFQ